MRYEITPYRDKTFDFYRRFVHKKLYSTDLDAVEFFNWEPIDIREYKSRQSKWKKGYNAGVFVQARLAERAGLDHFVIEHDDDWQTIDMYKIELKNRFYTVKHLWHAALQGYLMSLFEIRGLDYRQEKPELFTRLEPITREKVILSLWNELSQGKKKSLLQKLILQSSVEK